MLHLKEVTFEKDKKKEKDILINPYLVTSVRQSGLYTSLSMFDGQQLTLSNNFFEIKKMLADYINHILELATDKSS